MKTPLQIGITGGIGSGKSIVCKIFSTLGIPIYDADSQAKNLMITDTLLISQIRKAFGNEAYYPDGSLNRRYLGQQAFASKEKVDLLNQLVHPRVGTDYAEWAGRNTQHPYLIKEAALLFEAASYKELDKIVVVTAPEKIRIDRVRKRDPQRTEADIQHILGNQWSEDEKIRRADFILNNDGTKLLIPQVLSLHQHFLVAGMA
jgi:dephospho-CoA kinase